MGDTNAMKLNILPAPTFRWLRMNDASCRVGTVDGSLGISEEIPGEVRTEGIRAREISGIRTGCGRAVDELLVRENAAVRTYRIGGGVRAGHALRLDFPYEKSAGKANELNIVLEAGSELVTVMDFTSDPDAEGFAAVQTKIRAGEKSRLTLVQIVRVGEKMTFVNDVGVHLDDDAELSVIHLFLSGGRIYQGLQTELFGNGSAMRTDTGYIVRGGDLLDMNYNAVHTGKKTVSGMTVNGVLRDKASKTFRGTIDFVRGSAGSSGDETEDVLLLSDDVVNRTIPLILCAEEDVSGNHGATIGRIQEDMLFYLSARGMSENDIVRMLEEARLNAVIRSIPDEKTREKLRGPGDVEEEPALCPADV